MEDSIAKQAAIMKAKWEAEQEAHKKQEDKRKAQEAKIAEQRRLAEEAAKKK